MGNAFRWWADRGTGWEAVASLRGTGGSAVSSEGANLWVAGQWGVFHGDGESWTDLSAGLPGEGTVQDIAGLGDGRVAMVSNEEVIDADALIQQGFAVIGFVPTVSLPEGADHTFEIRLAPGFGTAGTREAYLFIQTPSHAITILVTATVVQGNAC